MNTFNGKVVNLKVECVVDYQGFQFVRTKNVTIGSVVTLEAIPGQRVTGNFPIPHDKFIANLKRNLAD